MRITKIMKTRQQKKEILQDLSEKLAKTKSAVFVDYTGLSVNKTRELRRQLKTQSAEIKVAKKTLIDLAFKQAGLAEVDSKNMSGQVALVMGYGDEVAPAKILYNFGKTNEHLKILSGILNNSLISAASVIELAKLPSRQELLAKAVGSVAAPLAGLVNILQGNLRSLVYVLSQIKN